MTLTYDRQIAISEGDNRKSLKWLMVDTDISALYSRFEKPIRGTETMTAYLAMSKAEQDSRKDIGGFVGGRLNGPRRKRDNVVSRCIVTLDMDTIPPYGTDKVIAKLDQLGCGYAVYSTRKHRPEAPRLRIVIVTDRDMSPDEYDAVSRRIAAIIGIEMISGQTPQTALWPRSRSPIIGKSPSATR
ncbi:MAG: hypothetical protein IKE76_01600 [Clostridia bacterium]|nr:hypothetical protein [Clostridia bacterium]